MARAVYPLANGQKPAFGPSGIGVNFDFTGVTSINGDLTVEQQAARIDFVQSIFIDNRLNGSAFIITFRGFSFTINCKANRQGVFPVLAPANASLAFTATSAGGVVVPTIMMNIEAQNFIWDV